MKHDVEINQAVPKHLATLLKALANLGYLEDAHTQVLLQDQPPEARIPDRETVFMQAGIALLCAAWEAYVEDLALHAFDYLIEKTTDPQSLPKSLKKTVAFGIKTSKNELSPWILAGDGWRGVVRARVLESIESLHNPKPAKIDALFEDVLGIKNICDSWEWEDFPKEFVRHTMLRMVEQRGAVAHGRTPDIPTGYNLLSYWKSHVVECAFRLNNKVVDTLTPDPAPPCWALATTNSDWSLWADFMKNIRSIVANKS